MAYGRKKASEYFPRRPLALATLLLAALLIAWSAITPVSLQALSGSDWKAGRIIDDSVFYHSNAMSIEQIQHFLNAKVPNCDRWGTQPYSGTSRRAYSEARGIVFPLTCLKDYHENPTTRANNLEGRPIPPGAMSAAHIIWAAGQQYGINPQVILVTLQKEQALTLDDWPWPGQFRTAMGYGCPDSTGCDANYFGFYNQVMNAARQFRLYANNPNAYNHVPGNTFVRYNPNGACGGSTVFIENQATASLYNYTPYQPNQAALNNLYGPGDSCSAHGNRNFWQMFNNWFGSTHIFDPFGWEVIRTESDGREFLVVGNTKRWIPGGEIKNDWNLGSKPVRIVSQAHMDSIPTLPTLERLGILNNRYYYVSGGKKHSIPGDEMLRAWGFESKKHLAVPAYSSLATLPEGPEVTFYASAGGQVARIVDGRKYLINPPDAARWQANPVVISQTAFNEIAAEGPMLDYHISVDGVKYVVDEGRLINVSNPAMLRDYDQAALGFPVLPSRLSQLMPRQDARRLINVRGTPHWFMLFGGQRYYVPSASHALSWNEGGGPLVLSAQMAAGFPDISTHVPTVVREQESGKIYIIDGTRHEAVGAMLDAIQSPSKEITAMQSQYLAGVPMGQPAGVPVINAGGHIFSIIGGELFHIPNGTVLNAYGIGRKYQPQPINPAFAGTMGQIRGASLFVENAGTTYFLQDGYAYPISPAAKADWLGGSSPINYTSSGFASRFDIKSQTLNQFINENGRRMVMSHGWAVETGGSGDVFGPISAELATLGLNRTGTLSYLVRPSFSGDVWLINNNTRQYISSGEELNAFSKNGRTPVTTVSPTALAALPQVREGQKLSPFVFAASHGAKLINGDGSYFEFGPNGAYEHFAGGRTPVQLNASTYFNFSETRGAISRLIRDPAGKVYWVEDGKKHWVATGAAFNRLRGSWPVTDVGFNIISWLPEEAAVTN